jgi:signal transduction histidine kinase
MEELARATAAVDLDRLDVRFATARDDEIGVLSRRLSSMIERLRGSAAKLREAERRATVGEVARQVNHDIKNGLAPIRNVVRHLAQVARDEPGELAGIFTARQGTLESSISYLETLAQNYARLTPSLGSTPCDVGAVIAEVAGSSGRGVAAVRARVAPGVGRVAADAVVLRRIIENLVGNAVDSLEGKAGEVTVSAELATDPRGQPLVRVLVADTGRGMSERELGRAFDDFYTTKPNGTGLGLSVVRRLVADLGGSLRVETEPGRGTRIWVDLPVAGTTVGVSSDGM